MFHHHLTHDFDCIILQPWTLRNSYVPPSPHIWLWLENPQTPDSTQFVFSTTFSRAIFIQGKYWRSTLFGNYSIHPKMFPFFPLCFSCVQFCSLLLLYSALGFCLKHNVTGMPVFATTGIPAFCCSEKKISSNLCLSAGQINLNCRLPVRNTNEEENPEWENLTKTTGLGLHMYMHLQCTHVYTY